MPVRTAGLSLPHYYLQLRILFQLKDIIVAGFCGHKRQGADIKSLIQAGKQVETVYKDHANLLSLSSVCLPDGDFGNLALFTDPKSRDQWTSMALHRDLAATFSPLLRPHPPEKRCPAWRAGRP